MTSKLILLSVLLLLIASGSCQSNCVTIYKSKNLAGSKTNLCSTANLASSFDNTVSSIKVASGYSAVLFQDRDFQGQSLTINEGTWNAPNAWNDKISSIIVIKGRVIPQFYDSEGLQNFLFSLGVSSDITGLFGDRISSVFVPDGWNIILFGAPNFGDDELSLPLGPGVHNIDSDLDDLVSSVAVFAPDAVPEFFNNVGLQGFLFSSSVSQNVSTKADNRISSVLVPTGWTVFLYADSNFRGQVTTLTEGVWNADGSWDNQISSVGIFSPDAIPQFYDGYNLDNLLFSATTGRDITGTFGDRISSVTVPPGYNVVLYVDPNFTGKTFTLTPGAWNLRGDLDNTVSSVGIFRS